MICRWPSVTDRTNRYRRRCVSGHPRSLAMLGWVNESEYGPRDGPGGLRRIIADLEQVVSCREDGRVPVPVGGHGDADHMAETGQILVIIVSMDAGPYRHHHGN